MTSTTASATVALGEEAPPAGVVAAAEVATAAVSLTLVASSVRLFTDRTPLLRWVLVVVAIHLAGAVTRRFRLRPSLAVLGHVAVGVLVVSWLYLPGTLAFGFPTRATLEAARFAVDESFAGFRTLVAPVAPSTGFELVLAVSFATFASFMQLAAFRGRAPFQAVLPAVGAFVVVSIFALDRASVAATACFVAAILLHLSCHRTLRLTRERWASADRRPGGWSLLGAAAMIAAAASLIGALAGPLLPGAHQEAVVDLRSLGRKRPPLEIGNPLVGVSNLLGEQSDVEMFRVRTDADHYWRLTALERYDPSDGLWKTKRSYQDVSSGDQLQPATRVPDGALQSFEVQVTGLPGIWFPSPYSAASMRADAALRYDPDSGSVIAGEVTSVPSITYSLTALIPSPSRDRAPFSVDPDEVPEVYSSDPQLSPEALAWLRGVEGSVPSGANLAERARVLQDVFRGFDYDTGVDYSRAPDPVVAFLRARRGFCQQFASVFAQMARVWGIPSRVGVGFTWGDEVAGDGPAAPRTLVVRGRNAHAWPELYLGRDLGWVAFEPTPGRGDPANSSLTGAPPAQAPSSVEQPPGATTTTTAPDPAALPPAPTTTTTVPAPSPSERAHAPDAAPASWPLWLRVLVGVVGALAMVALAIAGRVWWVSATRSRRWRAARQPADRVQLAWRDAVSWLAHAGTPIGPTETPVEYARRARVALALDGPGRPGELLDSLAALETRRVHAGAPPAEDDADSAVAAAIAVEDAVEGRVGRAEQARRRLGLPPGARADRQLSRSSPSSRPAGTPGWPRPRTGEGG